MTTMTQTLSGIAVAAVVASAALTPTPAAAWQSSSDTQLINKMIHALSPSSGAYKKRKHRQGWAPKYGHKKHYRHDHGYRDPHWRRGFAKRYGWQNKPWLIRSHRVGHVDLQVFFHIGSANLSPRAYRILDSLGEALSYGSLRHSYFLIGGHTDASGSYEGNQHLSERRAYAVKRYLTRYFGIATKRLVSIGYGEDRLAYPGHPYASKNRRVEVSVISRAQAYRIRRREHRRNDYAQY